jgi:CHAD domain-containing protein
MPIDSDRILKSVRKLRKCTARLPKEPSPADIHKLRTTARKLEAMFTTLSLDSRKNESQLIKRVRKIRKRAGKVRDLDVLTGDLAAIRVDGETECQVRLLEHLGGERLQQAAKLRKLVSNNRAELKSRLRKASARLDKALQNTEPQPASLAAAESLRLASELDIPRRFNKGNLHPYRLKVKQLRYVLNLAPDHPKFLDDLDKVKDAIGEWHDWEELVAIANNVLDHGTSCKLVRELKETADSKFEHAVRTTEGLRKAYLKMPSRKKPSRPVELNPAVIEATAALSEDVRRAA